MNFHSIFSYSVIRCVYLILKIPKTLHPFDQKLENEPIHIVFIDIK